MEKGSEIEELNSNNETLCLRNFPVRESYSACLVADAKPVGDAKVFCETNNMTLMRVQTSQDFKALSSVAKELFGQGNGTVIWIEGKWDFDVKEWRTYGTNKSLTLYKKFETPLERFHGLDNYCLSIQSYFLGRYEVAPVRCKHKCYFFCEYEN